MSFRVTHPNLTKYVATKNAWDAACRQAGRPDEPDPIDLRHLTDKQKQRLMWSIEGELSPENLCCDGELRGAALRQKAAYLNAVKAELETL